MTQNSPKQMLKQMRNGGEITHQEYAAVLKQISANDVKPWTIRKSILFQCIAYGLLLYLTLYTDVIFNLIDRPHRSATSSVAYTAPSTATAPQSGMAYTNQQTLACVTNSDLANFSAIYTQQGEAAARAYGNCVLLPLKAQVFLVQGGFLAGLGKFQELRYQTANGPVTLVTTAGAGRFTPM